MSKSIKNIKDKPQSGVEGEAPVALPMEGATRAPIIADGFLLVDKPAGITSQDLLNILKKELSILGASTAKLGHTGTLDPFATGLMVVGMGEALKFISYLHEEPKVYLATLKLGERTDTQDNQGKVIETMLVPPLGQSDLQREMKKLCGKQEQIPPMFSAKKIQGKKLYELARQGKVIPREPISIIVDKMELVEWNSPYIRFLVSCSRGTYVRTLGETLAINLRTTGHLTELRRLKAGMFDVEESFSIDVRTQHCSVRTMNIIPIIQALSHLDSYEPGEAEVNKLFKGQPINCGNHFSQNPITLITNRTFLGIAEYRNNQLWPKRLMNQELIK